MLETKIIEFFSDLSDAQEATFEILQRKTQHLAHADIHEISELLGEEQKAVDQLRECLNRREKILELAKNENLPHDSLESLVRHLSKEHGDTSLMQRCLNCKNRTRIMQLQSLTNRVLVQRSISHFSQILEMIAAKGRINTTYERKKTNENFHSGGALVDLGG